MRYALVLALVIFASLPAARAASLPEIFERTWSTARDNIYPGNLTERFDEATHARLRAEAENAKSLAELGASLNRFLLGLGVSHTFFYQSEDPDYYFMRSLFNDESVDARPIWHSGLQGFAEARGYRVREVLDGLPAQAAGLRRGDLLLGCGPIAFHPLRCFADGAAARVRFERNGRAEEVTVSPVYQAPARSFLEAMKNGARLIQTGGRRIGYVHLWIGPFEENIAEYHRLVESFRDTDGIILDLRGGFGGASLDRVDPFYADRSTYPKMAGIDRSGTVSDPESWEQKKNEHPYEKPLVVLLNEGVRSGKEMMAFQLAKGRATLVGSRTAGMFVGGRLWFGNEDSGYALYLSSMGALLDGVNLEGVGVRPNVEVAYPLDQTLDHDPQLEKALEIMRGPTRGAGGGQSAFRGVKLK